MHRLLRPYGPIIEPGSVTKNPPSNTKGAGTDGTKEGNNKRSENSDGKIEPTAQGSVTKNPPSNTKGAGTDSTKEGNNKGSENRGGHGGPGKGTKGPSSMFK